VSDEPPIASDQGVSADAERRLSFGSVAEQYDRHRPGYPPELVDDVLTYAGAHAGDRALEVGAGTGKATLMFAQRGLKVTALEPDVEMAAVASERAATAGLAINLITSDFETAFDTHALPEHAFKLLLSGTAWHWVTRSLRNELAARALVTGGTLAPFWNRPVWDGNPLRPALEAAYREIAEEFAARPSGPMNPLGAPLEIKTDREWLQEEFSGSSEFTDVQVRHYTWSVPYEAAEYVALTGTHSDHILLPEAARERLFAAITDAIDAVGGSLELTYVTLLCLARRC
jgi:SAM-dependent methyltransferase